MQPSGTKPDIPNPAGFKSTMNALVFGSKKPKATEVRSTRLDLLSIVLADLALEFRVIKRRFLPRRRQLLNQLVSDKEASFLVRNLGPELKILETTL